MEAVARAAEATRPQMEGRGGLVGLGRLARRLADSLDASEEVAEEVQLATLVGLVQKFPSLSEPEELLMGLPVSTRRLLEQLEERWDGSGTPEGLVGNEISLGARIGAVCLALAETAGSPNMGRDLEAHFAGRFDPSVLHQLDALGGQPQERATQEPERAQAARRRRFLLSLARMLESEDPDSSQKAYEDLSQDTGVSRETVEAILGLARLASRRGQREQVVQWARQAPQLARQVGPVPSASASLDAALLIGGPEGLRLAEDSFRTFGQLRNPVGQARAYLAAFWLRGSGEGPQLHSSAELLGGVAASGGLRPDLPWLLPLLAGSQSRASDAEVERLLVRLVRNNPQEAGRQIESTSIESPSRVEMVKALAGAPGVEALLQRIGSSPDEAIRKAAQLALRQSGGAAGPPPLRIFSLGILEVYRGEERVPDNAWKSQKVRYMLACMASQSGRAVSEDILIEEFWPDDPSKGKQNVYAAVSSLRRTLRPSHWEGTDLDYVLRTPRGLQLNAELPRWDDMEEFTRMVGEAQHKHQAGQLALAADHYTQAVKLYRGPYLEGCYMEWVMGIRTRVERQVLEAYRNLLTLTAQQSHWVEVLEHGHRLLEIDPCCQEAFQHLMQANLAMGRAEESVRLYEQCCKLLRRELAMEPSIAIFEQYQRARISLSA